MMTTDAYAQTNTERLITAVDNTNSIVDALAALADAVSSGFASVMASLGMIQADTESIQTELGHVESGLADISSDVASVKDDVASLSNDVSDINSNVASVQNDVSSLNAVIAGSGSAITDLSNSVNSNAASINALTALVEEIQAELMTVDSTVTTVNSTATSIEAAVTAEEAATARAIVQLLPGTTFGSATVADFGAGVTAHPFDNVYDSVNSLICNNDVFVQSVEVTDDNSVLTVASPSATAHAESTVTVNGHLVFAASLQPVAGAAPVEVQAPVDLSNTFLPAGEKLHIVGSTDQSANNVNADGDIQVGDPNTGIAIDSRPAGDGTTTTEIYPSLQQYINATDDEQEIYTTAPLANVTKAMLGEVDLYKLKITWTSPDEGTLCYVSGVHETIPSGFVAVDPETDPYPSKGTVLVSLDVVDGEADPPSALTSDTISCGTESAPAKAQITGAKVLVGTLSQFTSLMLTAGEDDAGIRFHSNSTLDDVKSGLPFDFSGSVDITGKATSDVLIQVEYATVKGQSCDN